MADIMIPSPLKEQGDNYLGSIEVVDGIVRDFVSTVAEADDPDEITAKADDLALIFSGGKPGYSVVPHWNTRQQLGLYIVKHYGKADPESSVIEILKVLFLDAAMRVLEAVKATMEQGDEAGTFQVDALIEELVAILTGTWEITFPPDEDEE